MHYVLIYGFPVILILFEWGLRTITKVDSFCFVGPTLTAAALTFLIPLTKPKSIKTITENGIECFVTPKRDIGFINIVIIFVLIQMFAWAASCFLSLKDPKLTIWGIPVALHFCIGITMYFVSIIMVVIKGRI
jgi:hypothetical protein